MTVYAAVSYGTNAGETIDIYVPSFPTTQRPCVVLIHGGGWSIGDKRSYASFCLQFMRLGFVACTLNYRLTPSAVWPQQIGDVQLAIRYLKNNAGTYNLDPARIGMVGDSAGAHLCLCAAAYMNTIHTNADTQSQLPGVSNTIACVVDLFGPADMVYMYNNSAGKSDIVALANTATPTSNAALYADMSPTGNVGASFPPTLIFNGTTDTYAPPQNALNMQAALAAQGVQNNIYFFGGGHEWLYCNMAEYRQIQWLIQQFLVKQLNP